MDLDDCIRREISITKKIPITKYFDLKINGNSIQFDVLMRAMMKL